MTRNELTESQSFTIATLGFDEAERRVLRKVLFISESRTPDFVPYQRTNDTCPNIVIVNSEHPKTIDEWRKYKDHLRGKALVSEVFLSHEPHISKPKYELLRPFHATRLFALLERAVTDEHGFEAPLGIDGEESLIYLPGDKKQLDESRAANDGQIATVEMEYPPNEFRALVVDDSLPVRIQLKNALTPIAKHIDFAETGEAALEFIEHVAYDLVFLDVILPGIDGYEVCRKIKKHPMQKDASVLMLTGNTSPADRVKGKLAGCDTYLIKPIGKVVFEQVVSEYLGTSAAA